MPDARLQAGSEGYDDFFGRSEPRQIWAMALTFLDAAIDS